MTTSGTINIPAELAERPKREAKEHRSLNTQIIATLEQAFSASGTDALEWRW